MGKILWLYANFRALIEAHRRCKRTGDPQSVVLAVDGVLVHAELSRPPRGEFVSPSP